MNFLLTLLFVVLRTLFWLCVVLVVISAVHPTFIWNIDTDKATPFDVSMDIFWLFGVPCFILSFLVGFFAPSQVHNIYYLPVGIFVLLFYKYCWEYVKFNKPKTKADD